MRRVRRALLGALIGSLPGLGLLALTGPVSGEAELTLGVGAIFVALVGAAAGGAIAISNDSGGR